MTDVLAPPSRPVARPGRVRRFGRFLVRFVVAGVTFTLLLQVASIALRMVSHEEIVPTSCRQPSHIDYLKSSPPSISPVRIHAVELNSWSRLAGGTSSEAFIGHSPTVDAGVFYGYFMGIESTDIHAFRCSWSPEGVTIIEPDSGPGQPGIEHFVPAERFVGGR